MVAEAFELTGVRESKLDISGYTPPDERFGKPFIDIDEERESPRQMRYIHGGFEGTHTRFSFYFPPAKQYRKRFFQFLEGGAGGHESLLISQLKVGLAFDWVFGLTFDELGGYCVESNQGHFPGEGTGFNNDIELYAASAESALFGKYVAGLIYGDEPEYGYIWGVSGGGNRSGHCLEERPDVWQGGSPHAGIGQSTQWSPWALTWLLARKQFPQIIDATEPGGSGNPFEGLNHAQREALAELYRRGYPRGGESQLGPFMAWAFSMYNQFENDPGYLEDFWNTPGYIGHDDPRALDAIVLNTRAKVSEIIPASKSQDLFAQMLSRMATAGAAQNDPTWSVRLEGDIPDIDLVFMSNIKVLTGKAAGRELVVANISEGMISPFSEMTPDVFDGVEPGDEVMIDNRPFVAFAFYHLYSIDNSDGRGGIYPELDPWAVDGHPVYPQRANPATRRSGPLAFKADLKSKMIYVQPTLDNMVWPTTISPYHRALRENMGDRLDQHFRMWFAENACHGTPELIGPMVASDPATPGIWRSRLVSYDGVTAQALRDLVGWVERNEEPHTYADYVLTRDNQLLLPAKADERGGVQPVVYLEANGSLCARVKVGDEVSFSGVADQPPGAGTIVGAEWDFEGTGAFVQSKGIDGASAHVEIATSHRYQKPGTYFACLRVAGHCDGAIGAGIPVHNLARARVVVS